MRALTFMSGAAVGAGLMYLMDPERGSERRADLRETLTDLAESDMVERAVERARTLEPLAAVRGLDVGTMLEGSGRMLERSGVPERAARWWSQTSGPALRRSRGWMRSGSMGSGWMGRRRQRQQPTLDPAQWALLGGVLGAVAVGLWLGRRTLAHRGEFEVVRTVTIDAPVERVYEFWNDFENFPRFMSHVREVRRLGPDRSRWTVAGPAGAPIEWEAIVTHRVANEAISWRTVEGAAVDHRGTVRFRPAGTNATRVEVRLAYRPLGGSVGHGIASLFGRDPESVIDADLARLGSQLRQRSAVGETGTWR